MKIIPETSEDQQLISASRQGDSEAFVTLMRRYNQRLFRTIRAILPSDQESQDALQETWWSIYANLEGFREEAAVSTWMTRIAVNQALMVRRKAAARAKVIQSSLYDKQAQDAVNDYTLQAATPTSTQPDYIVWRSEIREMLQLHIDALPEKYRTVFMLKGVEGLEYTEIAEILSLPESTVRVRYMRARQKLQATIIHDFDPYVHDAFAFMGTRCDDMVKCVAARLPKRPATGLRI